MGLGWGSGRFDRAERGRGMSGIKMRGWGGYETTSDTGTSCALTELLE